MSAVMAVVLGMVAVGGVVAGVMWSRAAGRKRTETLAYASQALGLAFEPVGDLGLLTAAADFPLFGQGHSRSVRNVMTGRLEDVEVRLFDYRYTTGSGQHSHTHVQTVAVMPAASPLPDFVLAPENVFHRIGQLFGYQDIDFEAHPEFSSHYLLRGRDEDAIRAAFDPNRLAFLGGTRGWTIQSRNGQLAVFRADVRVKPEDLSTFLEESRQIGRAFKDRW